MNHSKELTKRKTITYTTDGKSIPKSKNVLKATDTGQWAGIRMEQLTCLAWIQGIPNRRFPDILNVREKPWENLKTFCKYAGLDNACFSNDGRCATWDGKIKTLSLHFEAWFAGNEIFYTVQFK